MLSRLRPLLGVPRQVQRHATLARMSWLVDESIAACSYPRGESALRELADRGVTLVINLHQQPHRPDLLARCGITEIHLPVPDFTPPTPEQLERGVAAVEQAVAAGRKVAVHCGGGLGRTGTLLACYLVRTGLGPSAAIARVREVRPGSVETRAQEAAVQEYARSLP